MIIREWRGRALLSRGDAYLRHFNDTVLPHLRTLPGFAGASLLRRQVGDGVEFVVLTRWDSLDSIRGFAGSDFGNAVVEPAAVAALANFDKTVQHYEVLTEASA
jgi:heme-degrading monooxygenase HmoA